MNRSVKWALAGAAITGLAASLCAWGATAQTLDVGRRPSLEIAQLSPPGNVPAQSDANADPADTGALLLRVDRLEEQLRQANGQIEELQNQESRLEAQLKKFREDVEYRLGDRSGGGATPSQPGSQPAPVADATPAFKPARKDDAFDPSTTPHAPGAPQPLGTTAASAPLRAASLAGVPLDLASRPPPAPVAAPAAVSSAGIGLVDGPREQYNTALQDYQNGQYERAEAGFKTFLAANSSHRLAPEAIFFLGETYLQRSRPREAAEQYLRVSTNFGKSPRAPESMVRLGQSLAALGNTEQACATFGEFNRRYPTAQTSVKRLAEREMQKDHC